MPTSFSEKRTPLLLNHWSVVAPTLAVLYIGDRSPGWSLHEWLMLVLLGAHAAVSFLPKSRFQEIPVIYGLALLNLAGASLAVSLSEPTTWAFLGLLPLAALIAQIPETAPARAGGAALVALCYPAVLFFAGQPIHAISWWITALLFWTCHFMSYLFHLQSLDADRARADTLYTSELVELGDIRSDDLASLLKRAQLLAKIMSADNCELAFVKNDLITQRILPNRTRREYDGVQTKQSIHEKTLTSADTYCSSDIKEDPWFATKQDFAMYPYRAYMGRALTAQGRAAGYVALYMEEKFNWDEIAKKKFQFLVNMTALAIQNDELRKELENQARNDGLTKLFNHRYFYEWLEEEFERTKRKSHFLSIALLDLDHFKQLNDTAGHRAGDQVLEALGKMFTETVRSMDRVGRLGGDEFAIALPETSLNDAFTLCQRILQNAAKLKVGETTGFSLSIGCAAYPQDGDTLNLIMERADQALYRSKELGRGRVSRYADIRAAAEQESADRLIG